MTKLWIVKGEGRKGKEEKGSRKEERGKEMSRQQDNKQKKTSIRKLSCNFRLCYTKVYSVILSNDIDVTNEEHWKIYVLKTIALFDQRYYNI